MVETTCLIIVDEEGEESSLLIENSNGSELFNWVKDIPVAVAEEYWEVQTRSGGKKLLSTDDKLTFWFTHAESVASLLIKIAPIMTVVPIKNPTEWSPTNTHRLQIKNDGCWLLDLGNKKQLFNMFELFCEGCEQNNPDH